MCGIAGIAVMDGPPPAEPELGRMSGCLAERGPDAHGCLLDGRVGLAHRRLKILDLTAAGDQPMRTPDGACSITFNGEIYNFLELRAELQARGHAFASRSDTEVVLAGYREWGIPKLLERLDGMFAFALHDKPGSRLFLCRDRFGKKPLYYLDAGGRLKFASEIRAIHATETDLSLDHESLDYYLAELTVPQPRSIWREVRQLPPAHWLEVDLGSNARRLCRYWSLVFEARAGLGAEETEAEVERLIARAVAKRTVADVPVGAFLSGGVDSGLVVACLARGSGGPVRTFTVGLGGASGDEAAEARRVAGRWGTQHTEIRVDPSLVADLPRLVEYFGEPFADASALPSYYVARAIGAHVKVALSGDGGDELFGGYHDYAWAHLTDEYLRSRPSSAALRDTATLLSKGLHRLGIARRNYGHYEAYAARPGGAKLFREMGFEPGVHDIYGPAFEERARGFAASQLGRTWDANQRATLAETLSQASLETRLLNDYLVKVDRTSMINSVEVRSPFLDRELAEFVARLPARLKYGDGTPKFLLRRLASRLVDAEAMSRPKRGFGLPLGAWLRDELRGFARDAIFGGALARSGLVRMATVERVFEEHVAGVRDHADRLWCLLVLELWLARFRP